jgi:predicted CoA-binding protein
MDVRSDSAIKVIVIGASPDPGRYAYFATLRLLQAGYKVVPVGIRPGTIGNETIRTIQPREENVHTVTVYLRPEKQLDVRDYIASLNPKRIIVNPGAESALLEEMAKENGIVYLEACTLALLSTGQFETAGLEDLAV